MLASEALTSRSAVHASDVATEAPMSWMLVRMLARASVTHTAMRRLVAAAAARVGRLSSSCEPWIAARHAISRLALFKFIAAQTCHILSGAADRDVAYSLPKWRNIYLLITYLLARIPYCL